IECSAMSQKYLGDTFDIHGGGLDLKFPHHENEIAQSEGATGKPFANYWMHNGYININNEKMSKSKGNFITVRELSEKYDLLAVRMLILSAHYRNPVNFSDDLLTQAEAGLSRIDNCRENLEYVIAQGKTAEKPELDLEQFTNAFKAAMDDDLNTADAISAIFEMVRAINTAFADGGDAEAAKQALAALDGLLDVLGLVRKTDEIPAEIVQMAENRAAARKAKNWDEADALRDEIKNRGYELKDTPDGFKITKL
ncbi:MAG: DALR domain-containing protein, partial [Christensenellaceae bacterium]